MIQNNNSIDDEILRTIFLCLTIGTPFLAALVPSHGGRFRGYGIFVKALFYYWVAVGFYFIFFSAVQLAKSSNGYNLQRISGLIYGFLWATVSFRIVILPPETPPMNRKILFTIFLFIFPGMYVLHESYKMKIEASSLTLTKMPMEITGVELSERKHTKRSNTRVFGVLFISWSGDMACPFETPSFSCEGNIMSECSTTVDDGIWTSKSQAKIDNCLYKKYDYVENSTEPGIINAYGSCSRPCIVKDFHPSKQFAKNMNIAGIVLSSLGVFLIVMILARNECKPEEEEPSNNNSSFVRPTEEPIELPIHNNRYEQIIRRFHFKTVSPNKDDNTADSIRSGIDDSENTTEREDDSNVNQNERNNDKSTNVITSSWKIVQSSLRASQLGSTLEECCICLCNYEAGETICTAITTECNHVFHEDCIVRWLQNNDTCPLCKVDLMNEKSGLYEPHRLTVEEESV